MKTWVFRALILVVLFSWPSLLTAQPIDSPGRGHEDHLARMEEMKKAMKEKLHLTKEQDKMLEENRVDHKEKMKVLFEKIQEKRKALTQSMQDANFDKDKAMALHNELKQLMNAMMDLRFESTLRVREILTPEQRKEMFERFEGHFGGMSRFGHKVKKSMDGTEEAK